MNKAPFILASASPRRRELLALLGVEFQVLPSRATERFDSSPPARQAERLAFEKAAEVLGRLRKKFKTQAWVLGADTLVIKSGKLLGKPKSPAEARRMLKSLSGASHEVITGLALLPLHEGPKPWIAHERTRVWFRKLRLEEIDAYVRSGEPMDKAGAYGIQGPAGAFVKKIHGDYFNVVGLPLSRLSERLRQG